MVVGINGNSGNNAGMSIIAVTSSAKVNYFGDAVGQTHTVVTLIIVHNDDYFAIGQVVLKVSFKNSIKILETSSADVIHLIMVKWLRSTPNQLYFTTDAGDDIQITNGSTLANEIRRNSSNYSDNN